MNLAHLHIEQQGIEQPGAGAQQQAAPEAVAVPAHHSEESYLLYTHERRYGAGATCWRSIVTLPHGSAGRLQTGMPQRGHVTSAQQPAVLLCQRPWCHDADDL